MSDKNFNSIRDNIKQQIPIAVSCVIIASSMLMKPTPAIALTFVDGCAIDDVVEFDDIRAGGFQSWCNPGAPYNSWNYIHPELLYSNSTIHRGTIGTHDDFAIDWNITGVLGTAHAEFDISINMDATSAHPYGYGSTTVDDIIGDFGMTFGGGEMTSRARWDRDPEDGKTHTQAIIWLSSIENELNNATVDHDGDPDTEQVCLGDNLHTTIDITVAQWVPEYFKDSYDDVKQIRSGDTSIPWPNDVNSVTEYRGSHSSHYASYGPPGLRKYDIFRRAPGDICELASYILVPTENRYYEEDFTGWTSVHLQRVLSAIKQDMLETPQQGDIGDWYVYMAGWEVAGGPSDHNPDSTNSSANFRWSCYNMPSLNGVSLGSNTRSCAPSAQEVALWDDRYGPEPPIRFPPQSFEAASVPTLAAAKWYRSGGAADFEWQGRSGERSAKSFNRTSTGNGLRHIIDKTEIDKGDSMTIESWIKLQGSEWERHQTLMKIRVKDDDGVNWYTIGKSASDIFSWNKLTGSWVADWSGNLQSLQVYMSGPPKALNIMLDDVEMGLNDRTPTFGNILPNADFENNSLAGWWGWASSSNVEWQGRNSQRSGASKVRSNTSSGLATKLDISNIEAGDQLTLSAWVKLQGQLSTDQQAYIRVRVQDDNGVKWHTVGRTTKANIFDWKPVAGDWKAEWTGVLQKIHVVIGGSHKSLNMLIDDASLDIYR